MNYIKAFILCLGLCLFAAWSQPGAALAESAKYGVQVGMKHYAKHDDRIDLMMVNLTDDDLIFGYVKSDMDTRAIIEYSYNYNNGAFPYTGYRAELGKDRYRVSLTTFKWEHTNEGSGYGTEYEIQYNIGEEEFYLGLKPKADYAILTDLELAYHVIKSVGAGVEIAMGDEDSIDDLYKNMKDAIKEGNKLVKGSDDNKLWACISSDGTMDTAPSNLAYPIIHELIGGEYKFKKSSNDHIAFAVGDYVVQLASVNHNNDITGNTVVMCTVFTKEQWYGYHYPNGYIDWIRNLEVAGYSSETCAMAYDTNSGNYTIVLDNWNYHDPKGNMLYSTQTFDPETNETSQGVSLMQYDTGFSPDITIHGKKVIDVHNGEDEYFWTEVGDISGKLPSITWHESKRIGKGLAPRIDADQFGDKMVVVYQGETASTLKYRTSAIPTGETASLNDEYDLGSGYSPVVAIRNNVVVVVYRPDKNSKGSTSLGYMVGKVNEDGKTLSWYNDGESSLSIPDPFKVATMDIAWLDDEHVILTYDDVNLEAQNYAIGAVKLGDFPEGGKITWQTTISSLEGYSGSISSANGYVTLYYMVSDLDNVPLPVLIGKYTSSDLEE